MGRVQDRTTNKIKVHKKPTTYIIQITETSKNSIMFLWVKYCVNN